MQTSELRQMTAAFAEEFIAKDFFVTTTDADYRSFYLFLIKRLVYHPSPSSGLD